MNEQSRGRFVIRLTYTCIAFSTEIYFNYFKKNIFTTCFSGVLVTRSLVLCVYFVDRCLFFCSFSFGHCVVCSSIYGFWLPLWHLQTLLNPIKTHTLLNWSSNSSWVHDGYRGIRPGIVTGMSRRIVGNHGICYQVSCKIVI